MDSKDDRKEERKEEHERGRKRKGFEDEVGAGSKKRFMFTDLSRSGSSTPSSSFRRPAILQDNTPSKPTTPSSDLPTPNKQLDAFRSPLSQSHTPVPSVLTPPIPSSSSSRRALSPSSLNKLQAKVLRAKLIGTPDAEALEKKYQQELELAHGLEGGVMKKVEVLPTLDVTGRLYDVGTGRGDDDAKPRTGNRKKKEKARFYTP
jgi:hypothetical protein